MGTRGCGDFAYNIRVPFPYEPAAWVPHTSSSGITSPCPLIPALLRNGRICQFGKSSLLPSDSRLAHHGTCSPTQCVRRTRTMNQRRPINYLRSYRLRWGLSQKELAYLLGWDRPDVISRIEKKQRPPTLALVMACFILFDIPPQELFPDISAGIEHLVMARVQELYETIQGDPSRRTKKKIELLEAAIERADRRKRTATSV